MLEPDHSWRSRRTTFGVLSAVAVLVSFFWVTRLLLPGTHRGFSSIDDYLLYLPAYEVAAGWIKRGVLPLWNPYALCGIPWVAGLQEGFFYPPHVLYLLLPTPTAFAASTLLHLVFLAVSTVLFARRAGLGVAAAVLAAGLFVLRGTIPDFAAAEPSQFEALTWLPLGSVTVLDLARGGGRRSHPRQPGSRVPRRRDLGKPLLLRRRRTRTRGGRSLRGPAAPACTLGARLVRSHPGLRPGTLDTALSGLPGAANPRLVPGAEPDRLPDRVRVRDCCRCRPRCGDDGTREPGRDDAGGENPGAVGPARRSPWARGDLGARPRRRRELVRHLASRASRRGRHGRVCRPGMGPARAPPCVRRRARCPRHRGSLPDTALGRDPAVHQHRRRDLSSTRTGIRPAREDGWALPRLDIQRQQS